MDLNFFVEFQFTYDLTGRTYWLPLYIIAKNQDAADKIVVATRKALEEHFKNVFHSPPVPVLEFNKSYIQHKFETHRSYKIEFLRVDVWEFEDAQSDLSFNEQLDFIADLRPLTNRSLAKRIAAHQFPVRVIREGKFAIEFKEFLLINVVA